MRPDVQRWFAHRTFHGPGLTPRRLLARKNASVSVVLPALNEGRTIGRIVAAIHRELVRRVPLVDEIVVIDPGSTDGTARAAAAAGAEVVAEADVLPAYGRVPGKGEALWKSLHVTRGELVAFVDADLEQFDPDLVTGLLGPLLLEPAVSFVKASYERPLRGGLLPAGGGRVTELVARPLLNAHWPALAGVVQPLSGEYAARRSLLERLPFVSGYGVELALLVDVLHIAGLDAIAQVEVGRKVHRHQDDEALGRMAAHIWQTARVRLGLPADAGLTQFRRGPAGLEAVTTEVRVTERPPMLTVPEYVAWRARAS
ncbi:MAG TPA: glucosyl-3-phosphoglycerate synthase [Frankiaceae bacterium]|nr:glucosyl-3-phosphoglycerate synthase [Frankiaceae bacterium]